MHWVPPKMEPHTDAEHLQYPHVIMTAGAEWDPKALDHNVTDQEDWCNTIKEIDDGLIQTPFDEYGNYRKRTIPEAFTVMMTCGHWRHSASVCGSIFKCGRPLIMSNGVT